VASYICSAGSGLGFYHIEVPELETTSWLNISNCGVVVIRRGEISLKELERELSEIFCKALVDKGVNPVCGGGGGGGGG
jgi:hypothetical protein